MSGGTRSPGWRPELDVFWAAHWAVAPDKQNAARICQGMHGRAAMYATLAGGDWEQLCGTVRIHRDAVILWLVLQELGLWRIAAIRATLLEGDYPWFGDDLPAGDGFQPIMAPDGRGRSRPMVLWRDESFEIQGRAWVREGRRRRHLAEPEPFTSAVRVPYSPVRHIGEARQTARRHYLKWWSAMVAIRRFVEREGMDLTMRLTGPAAPQRPWAPEVIRGQRARDAVPGRDNMLLDGAARAAFLEAAMGGAKPRELADRFNLTPGQARQLKYKLLRKGVDSVTET